MPANTILTMALTLSLGQVPYQPQGSYSSGAPAGAEASLPASATGGQYGHEEMYPYDAYDNWVNGHFQEIPSYRGYHSFRPYNYRHILSQSQISGGWGNSPQLPYSHEYFWRKSHSASPGVGGGYQMPEGVPLQPIQPVPQMQPPAPMQPLSPMQPVPYGVPTSRLSPVRSSQAMPPALRVPQATPPSIDPAVYQGPGRNSEFRSRVQREVFAAPQQGPTFGVE